MGDTYVLAVDPGDRHVGFAEWWTGELSIRCWEEDAAGAVDSVRRLIRNTQDSWCYDIALVVEAFQLYGDRAAAQIGSAMETSQMIGALKLTADQLGVEFVGQGALVKAAMRAQMKARGIQLRGSTHARDAGLHLGHYVLFHNLGLRDGIPVPPASL